MQPSGAKHHYHFLLLHSLVDHALADAPFANLHFADTHGALAYWSELLRSTASVELRRLHLLRLDRKSADCAESDAHLALVNADADSANAH